MRLKLLPVSSSASATRPPTRTRMKGNVAPDTENGFGPNFTRPQWAGGRGAGASASSSTMTPPPSGTNRR